MKKCFWIVLILTFQFNWSQTKIASSGLELRKSTEHQQITQIYQPLTNELFVSASDKEKITLFKFNRALFLVDSLQTSKQKLSTKLVGYSFPKNGQTVTYFASDDLKKIMAYSYDFENRETSTHFLTIPFKDEEVLTHFSKNNHFYILSQNRYEKYIKCYIIDGITFQEKKLDLSSINVNLTKNNLVSVVDYIENSSVEVIDNTIFNPLYLGAYKVKLYPKDNQIILTIDSSSTQTLVLEIDLFTFEITEKKFAQPELGEIIGNSNSYLFQDKLFQITVTSEQLTISIQDYASLKTLTQFNLKTTENENFINSPFLIQTGNKTVRELKNSKKFLSKLQNKSAGITVYESENNFLLTVGGTNTVLSTESLVFGSLFSVGSVLASGDVYIPELYGDQIPQNVFFECRLDEMLNPKKSSFAPLATDYINYFLEENSTISIYHLIKYQDFYLMSYYEPKEKQMQLRKFEDGYSKLNFD